MQETAAGAYPSYMEPEPEPEQTGASATVGVMGCRSPTCPPWLQAAIADIDQRVRALAVDDAAPPTEHSFAERAEEYYQKRPQLLALLADLHRRYLCLADRYCHHQHKREQPSLPASASSDCGSSDVDDRCSDAGSSLSFQAQHAPPRAGLPAEEEEELLVAELVAAWVERDVLADEAARRAAESARRIQLQGSLVEVLESERLVLLGENARLGFRATAAEDEAAAAAADLGYARRRAAEMARLVLRLREDHRACVLGRRAEALQARVYALELRNRECCEATAAWEAEVQRLSAENRRLADQAMMARRKRKAGGGGWWAKVRMAAAGWTPCAPAVTVAEQTKGKEDGKYHHYGGGCFCV